MAKNNLNIWVIIAIVVVLSIAVSLITLKMTGNVVVGSMNESSTLYLNKPVTFDNTFSQKTYTVTLSYLDSTKAQFSISDGNKTEKSAMLKVGESIEFADDSTIYISKISNSYWGGKYVSATFTSYPIMQPVKCIDSDGGLNYAVQGEVTLSSGITLKDVCKVDGVTLLEMYCDESSDYGLAYTCPYGCIDGACIAESGEVGVTYQGVLEMLNKCYPAKFHPIEMKVTMKSCDDVCREKGSVCVSAITRAYHLEGGIQIVCSEQRALAPKGMSSLYPDQGTYLDCICCSA
jgi:hypothetical protein